MNKSLDEFNSIVHLLEFRAKQLPKKNAFTFLPNPPSLIGQSLSYEELSIKSKILAKQILNFCSPGDRAVLIYKCDLDYIIGFFACLYARVIAVPSYPPINEHFKEKFNSVVSDCSPKLYLTTHELKFLSPANSSVITNDDSQGEVLSDFEINKISQDDIAFIQYTSGSTSHSKGVVLSHLNLLANVKSMIEDCEVLESDVQVSWLPLYHDMGLIGAILNTLGSGMSTYLMDPMNIAKPFRWLKVISDTKATITAAPNFALELATQRIAEDKIGLLNLESLRIFVLAGEQIKPQAVTKFYEKFSNAKFDLNSMVFAYGLAEGTLMLTQGRADNGFKKNSNYVSCGQSLQDTEVIIVNDDLEVLKSNCIGNIMIHGKSVAKGYWNKEKESLETFKNKINEKYYLNTFDLGYLDEIGNLVITGRKKNLIKINGKNYFPVDLESVAAKQDPLLMYAIMASFSVDATVGEDLIFIIELGPGVTKDKLVELKSKVSKNISETFGISVKDLIFVIKGQIPRTSSGKVKYFDCRKKYLENKLRIYSGNWRDGKLYFKISKKIQKRVQLVKLIGKKLFSNL